MFPDPEDTPKVIATVTINAPVDGTVQLVGSTYVLISTGGQVNCWLTSGAGNTSNNGVLYETDRATYVPTGTFDRGDETTQMLGVGSRDVV